MTKIWQKTKIKSNKVVEKYNTGEVDGRLHRVSLCKPNTNEVGIVELKRTTDSVRGFLFCSA